MLFIVHHIFYNIYVDGQEVLPDSALIYLHIHKYKNKTEYRILRYTIFITQNNTARFIIAFV